MLELHPFTFVALILAVLLIAFGAGLVILVVVGRRVGRHLDDVCRASSGQIQSVGESVCGIMSKTNTECARQLGHLGEAMTAIIELQHRQVIETYHRNAALTHMLIVGSGKHDRAVADMILTGGPPVSLVTRPGQHIPPRDKRQEAQAVMRRNAARFKKELGLLAEEVTVNDGDST